MINVNRNVLRWVPIPVARSVHEVMSNKTRVGIINSEITHLCRPEDVKSVKPRFEKGLLMGATVNLVTSNSPRRSSTCLLVQFEVFEDEVAVNTPSEEVAEDDS